MLYTKDLFVLFSRWRVKFINQKVKIMTFENAPLITLGGMKATPQLLLFPIPHYVSSCCFVDCAAMGDLELPPVVVVFGKKHPKSQTMTALQWAALKEAMRLGHIVVTNSNFKKPRPRIYSKLFFRDVPEDSIPLWRWFANAGYQEAVSTLDIESDIRPSNLVKFVSGKPQKNAEDLVLHHVQRLADEREQGGTFPTNFTKDEYIDNFLNLLKAMREEASRYYQEEGIL